MKYIVALIFFFKLHKICRGENVPQVVFSNTPYEPTWSSLDSRPLPAWYDQNKIGIFIHWGVFSVPSFHSEWFWREWKDNATDIVNFMDDNYPKGFSYQEFAKDFTAEFFNATQWAQLFKASGARYVVLTSKHHEGFTMWPSKYSFSWNSKDVGPHKDLIGELSNAVRHEGLIFGLYHSLYEWFNPMYLFDKSNNFTTNEFVVKKCIPEMMELIENYKPEVLWSDGDWEATDEYWKSKEFLSWLYNDSPVRDTIVTNDRWGVNTSCKHGGFYSCADRFNPGTLQQHKWENAMTLDKKSWGFRRNAALSDYFTIEELLATLAQTISCGGNILINIGPTKEGTISPIFEERLLQLGEWLTINGEAIYGSTHWTYQNDTFTPGVWFTSKRGSIYAIVLKWPEQNVLYLKTTSKTLMDNSKIAVTMLGNDKALEWEIDEGSKLTKIYFCDKLTVKSNWAWVIKITYPTTVLYP